MISWDNIWFSLSEFVAHEEVYNLMRKFAIADLPFNAVSISGIVGILDRA